MPPHPGPSRKACSRCRAGKRKCDRAQPSCSLCSRLGQAELCIYEESATIPLPQAQAVDEASKDPLIYELLTSSEIKANIIAILSDMVPSDAIKLYSKTIHPWFGILSEATLSGQHTATWDAASVDFALLCFAIVLLNRNPQHLQGIYSLDPIHRSMYFRSKTWITLLERDGCNSMALVKARLLITLFEVSHGFDMAAYFSIANTVRGADALDIFQRQGVPHASNEQDREESQLMWWGIAILDRYIAIVNGKWPPITRGRSNPPSELVSNALNLQDQSSTEFSRLYGASVLLDRVHTAIHHPTPELSFNIEEVTTIVRTLSSFETVVTDRLPENSKLLSSCLTMTSTALLLAFDNGSKATCLGSSASAISQSIAALSTLIDDVVRCIVEMNIDRVASNDLPIPFFVIFLVYKTAAIITGRLQNSLEPEANLQRLRVLRKFLKMTAKRWLAGDRFLELLNEDTSPRILRAAGDGTT